MSQHQNRLAAETSPYLLQHAGNPVDWYPWGAEALDRARAEDRPILLSVGYSACHWCHVMERESFEDAETAALMNAHFVNVKVDREERPDVAWGSLAAVVALPGQGGGPMTVFPPPAGEPFFGGTYFPPDARYGMPAFRDVLSAVAESWRDRRDRIDETAATIAGHLRSATVGDASPDAPGTDVLDAAVRGLHGGFDPEWGRGGPSAQLPAAC